MKNFTNNFKQFTSRLSARWLIMALMMLVGTSSAWAAQYNLNWQGKVYFLAPEKWDLSTYSIVQVDITRTTTATESNYQFYAGKMTRIGTSRLFYLQLKANHTSWNQNEYITFTANDHEYNSGTFNINGNHYYATPLDYGCNNSSNYYLFKPSTESQFTTTTNGNTIKATYNSSRDNVLKADQTVNIYTDGSSSANGGSVSLKGYYLSLDNAITQSTVNSSSASANYGAAPGSEMILTASAKSGYEFDGWYNVASGGTLLSSSATYTYNVYEAKTIYARFKQSCVTPGLSNFTYTLPDDDNTKAGNEVMWDGNTHAATVTWAGGNSTEGITIYYTKTGGSKTQTAPSDAGTYTVTIETTAQDDFCATNNSPITLGTFTITCPTIAPPAITTSATVCAGTQVTLSNYNGVNDNTVKWYSDEECNSEVTEQVTLTDNGIKYNANYYAKAYHKASGCYSSEYSTLTFTVNPLPTISIGDNTNAVKFEDVKLTATGNNIADVKWIADKGTITKDATDPKKAVLTYDQTGTVTVTATATSAAGCTSAATKTVTFSEENCNSTTTTEQQTVGKTKIIVDNPQNWSTMKCYAWRTSDNKEILGGWSGTEMTKNGNNYEILIDFAEKGISESDKIKVIFNNGNSQTVDSDDVSCNKIYRFSIGSKSGDKYSFTSQAADTDPYTEPVEVTVDPPISAPAAKTISVSTTDGEGNIIFSGQVVKTGCDATNEYGFQHSSDGQTWTTVKVGENAVAGTAISNNTVNGLDGTYYVRAYITNDNSTQYGAIKEITVSTEKDPITTVTLTHVRNQAGEPYSDQELENLIYCVGDIVWFKLEQDGSNFQEYDWISYPGTGLTGMYTGGMFKFKITESGNVGIRLRNDANVDSEGNPTWVESDLLEFNTHPEPTAPTISFAKATICSNDNVGATLTLGATVSGQAYELWKYANDDDTEGSKVANVATLNCTENNQALQFSGIKTAGKYFVKTYYTAFCNTVIANSSYAILTVVNAEDVSISINPATATTTPWMPVKLTISATDDYTLEVPDGVEFSQNGNKVSVKIPLPDGATGGEGQYENVSFPQNATTSYTVTANLVSIGGEDNPCAVPATATITLTPYVEECTIGH